MTGWWNDLSSRERLLVACAALLAGALLLSLVIVRPLFGWNSSADSKVRQARDAYEMTAAAAAVSGRASTPAAASNTPLRQAILSTASNAGIELVRIGSASDSRIEIQAAPADSEILFAWLSELESTYGIHVTFADMTKGDMGRVNSQILVFEGGS
ncbi:type II secretion system protein GspM [Hyphococcus sp.]|uniref:type II secretion system protein GspM n=1 Tax=Hyphococcus sp. TaxID=2038636 RepID=UPI003CCC132C